MYHVSDECKSADQSVSLMLFTANLYVDPGGGNDVFG